ncbi:hypothetical protein HanIR_Chr01g0049911 [Helianthus annuus]|nr:hypothetical protein HanIR_Chr01g0049911 [Helianthus annuus]
MIDYILVCRLAMILVASYQFTCCSNFEQDGLQILQTRTSAYWTRIQKPVWVHFHPKRFLDLSPVWLCTSR